MSQNYVLAELRMHYPDNLHIGGYGVRVSGHGYRPRLWRLGPGKDVPRPKAMTRPNAHVSAGAC
ncbi:hypothetical protein AWV80_01345 [Cupriavidus sp. UYMU48A]|nr:hypothetical protein AWV80_01345 [Cupriavidus sp. UYMU48A]